MVEREVEIGILSKRLVEIDQLDKTLVELERDLLTLRKNGRKVPDRRTRFAEPETPPRDIIETVVNELGIRSSHLNTAYKAARPTHEGIEYLDYTTEFPKSTWIIFVRNIIPPSKMELLKRHCPDSVIPSS